jgi:hypothetical protein
MADAGAARLAAASVGSVARTSTNGQRTTLCVWDASAAVVAAAEAEASAGAARLATASVGSVTRTSANGQRTTLCVCNASAAVVVAAAAAAGVMADAGVAAASEAETSVAAARLVTASVGSVARTSTNGQRTTQCVCDASVAAVKVARGAEATPTFGGDDLQLDAEGALADSQGCQKLSSLPPSESRGRRPSSRPPCGNPRRSPKRSVTHVHILYNIICSCICCYLIHYCSPLMIPLAH